MSSSNQPWYWFIPWLIWILIIFFYYRLQMMIWSFDLKFKLRMIKRMIDEDSRRIEGFLKNINVESPSLLINRIANYFVIEPVSIEPIDIIKRYDHLIRTYDTSIRRIVQEYAGNVNHYTRSLLESSLSIYGVLNQIYRILRHYIIICERENNYPLMQYLVFIMPQILRIINTYHKALDSFLSGKPIGDGAGPLVALKLIEMGEVVSKKIVDETAVVEVRVKDRRIFVVKAEGPGSNVGKPGNVLSRLVDELSGNVDLIITIDAALRLEGERSGELAEGVGAAIGDPGPEKIAIERAASKYNIPLKAVIIKMSLEEALTTMKKELYEACERTVEFLWRIINESTHANSTIIVAGIGNSMGIPQ
uniref:DUF1512 domain-containing protein n=1 Tax=Staphylothermus marinus TaxID=2280 RepID=A0A7C4JLN9_STAMA